MKEPPVSKSFLPATQQQFEAVRDWLLPKLTRELPAFLLYHNVDHVKGVIKDSGYLLQKEGIPEEDKWMLLTAALFHDSGFLHTYKDHERVSCELAKDIL